MMYDRMKRFLLACIDVVMVLIAVGAMGGYVAVNSVIVTSVLNDLRLDTYITYETGLGVVMLILLLGWGPVWVYKSVQRSRYTGRL